VQARAQNFRVGTDGADSLGTISFQTGSGGNDVLYGLGGDDTLYGGANDDLLVGGTGDDTYVIDGPSDGVDTVFDESGTADRIHFDGAVANLPINFAHSGDDLLLTYGIGQQMTVLDHYAGFGRGVERLQFANGTTYAGYVLPNTVFFIDADLDGDADQNVIISADSGEALMGQGGVDLLFGNGGSDVLNGGTENDLLVGGLDDDTYQFGGAYGSDTIFDAGGGADGIVFTDAGNETLTALNFDRPSGTNLTITINSSTITVFNQFTAGNSIESVTFDGGATVFGYALSSSPYIIDPGLGGSGNGDIIASNSAAQALTGQGGGDLLFGNGGSDSPIDGGDGDDLLVGGTGSDVMSGGAGDDVLYGGTNNIGSGDSMAGGDGDDRFYFAGAGDSSFLSIDVISGFVAGGAIDEINLDAFNFTGTAVAALKETTPGSFVGSSAADFFDDGGTDRAVAVEYLGGNARVYVDANSDGNFTTADLVVQLNTIAVNALTIDDFMFN
jgi:Ca2+-binding RTX toxin-like protein